MKSLILLARLQDGLHDLVVASTSAKVAHHPFLDLVLRGRRVAVQKRLRCYDLSRCANAALEATIVDEALLQQVEGFAVGSWSSDTTHSMQLTFSLDELHQGDVASAKRSLEQQVDSGLLSYWAYTLAGDSTFDRSRVIAKSHDTIKQVAAYRRKHRPYYREGDLGETIASVLGSLQDSSE